MLFLLGGVQRGRLLLASELLSLARWRQDCGGVCLLALANIVLGDRVLLLIAVNLHQVIIGQAGGDCQRWFWVYSDLRVWLLYLHLLRRRQLLIAGVVLRHSLLVHHWECGDVGEQFQD